jgi:hypothetical protein
MTHVTFKSGPCQALTGSGLSPWRPGFDLRPVHVGFGVDKFALG